MPQKPIQELTKESLKNRLLAAVKLSVKPHKGLCIAYSGGLDSTVLLHLFGLLKLQTPSLEVKAFHVNHGLSPNAAIWQQHCQEQAFARNISLNSSRLKLQKIPQQSLEAIARDARYAALSDFAKTDDIVLLAQHQDDQAETLVLQLKRGAGVKGLSAMPAVYSNKQGTQFSRPLLDFSRQALLLFAQDESLVWIEDESNQDQSFDRNFLRQSVMPILNKRWPQFSATAARSASHCASTQAVVDEYMHLIKSQVLNGEDKINIPALSAFSLPTQLAFLRFWLSGFIDLPPSTAQLKILTEMLANKANQSSHLPLQSIVVEKSRDTLIILRLPIEEAINFDFEWQGDTVVAINTDWEIGPALQLDDNCFWLPYGKCSVHFGEMSYTAKMQANRPSKSLKVWCQEWSISALQRRSVPVLLHQDKVIAVQLVNANTTKIVQHYSWNNDIAAVHLPDGCWARFVCPLPATEAVAK